jgi:hypothetical protein
MKGCGVLFVFYPLMKGLEENLPFVPLSHASLALCRFFCSGCIHSFWVVCFGVESAEDGMSKPAC